MSKKVVFIGAAGEMCQVAVRRFANADPDAQLVLCDIRPELLADLVRDVSGARATAQKLDLYDAAGLRAVVDGADLVVLGAGPYTRTSAPVIEACIAAEVPYLDFDDDVESTEHALSQFDKLAAAGIPAYIGCGASPGMSNVLAVDAVQELDTVENIDLAWVVGDERPGIGRAVLEHFIHICAGDCVTWEGGKRVVHQSFVETGSAPMGGGLGETLMLETAHPEAVTMPRKPRAGPGSSLMVDMGDVTGAACAAFMLMALDEAGTRAGVFAPEDWAEPQAFYAALVRTGSRADDIVESVNGASPAPARPL